MSFLEKPQIKKTLTLTDTELRNVLMGLDLLHTEAMNKIAQIHPLDEKAPIFREYFKEKVTEINELNLQVRNLLK